MEIGLQLQDVVVFPPTAFATNLPVSNKRRMYDERGSPTNITAADMYVPEQITGICDVIRYHVLTDRPPATHFIMLIQFLLKIRLQISILFTSVVLAALNLLRALPGPGPWTTPAFLVSLSRPPRAQSSLRHLRFLTRLGRCYNNT